MIEDDDALGVGFEIDFRDSFGRLRTLEDMVGEGAAKMYQAFRRLQEISGNAISTRNSLVELQALTEGSREYTREQRRIEKSGEALSRQLTRLNDEFGKNRDQIRAAKVEATALAAETLGLTELADKWRAQQAALTAQQNAATAAKEAEATALRDAAEAYRMFEAVAKEKSAASREMDAQAAAAALEVEAKALRDAADAHRLFEAVAKQKASDYRAQEAREAAAAREVEANAVRDAAAAYKMFEAVAKQNSAAYREKEAQAAAAALAAEAEATARLAREHEQLAAIVRGSQAALEADAAAAERMRQATDPLYAATVRLNAEIAESTRLYHAGATAPAEYARQQQVLVGQLQAVQQQHNNLNRGLGTVGASGKLAAHHMQNLAFQFQDVGIQMFAAAQSGAPFKMAMMAVMQQGSQIGGIMMQAGVGIRAVGAAFLSMSKSILIATATNPYLMAGAAAIAAFAGAVKLLQNAANSRVDMKAYAESIGLTTKEIRNLDNVTVTFGDTAKAVFQVAGRAIWERIGPMVTKVWDTMKEWAAWIFTELKKAANFIIGAFVGGYRAIIATWRLFPAALGDLFIQAVNKAIEGVNWLLRKSIAGINLLVDIANSILPADSQLQRMAERSIDTIANQYEGAASRVAEVWRKEVGGAIGEDYIGQAAKSVGGSILTQAIKNAQNRVKTQAEEKGYLDPEKAKPDKHGERLARDAKAVEAQIRNLYALAAAYGESGAAALIAEARVKAESEAIKKRADIEAMVDRQIRLAIAQRITDAAKATAAVRDQASTQERVNQLVAAGNITAERAADLVKDQIADLPLLAAAQAAQQRGLTEEVVLATAALKDQRTERQRLRNAEEEARFHAMTATGKDRLTELREEMRLIGATNAERNIALAIMKAQLEADRAFTDPARRKAYVDQQAEIARTTENLAASQRAFNDALNYTADKWDLIAQNVQGAAQGIAEAFGSSGRALGDLASTYADYRAQQERADAAHIAALKEAQSDSEKQHEIAKYNLATSTKQVALYGDMASAAKGFFKEKSAGYKAMMAAEKVFRAFEFAMSVRAMVQDISETISSVANSGARATAAGAEGIANQSKLPFPFNIVAMAATGAALIAAGIAVIGGGRSGGARIPETNTGAGTVFGDSNAQSESIKNAINALKDVDTLMLSYSRKMAASLKSIESQIGGFANLLVRNADSIHASGGVTQGFNPNFIGDVLGKIPLVGGILKGLFGSKTTVIGSGLYGSAQSLGSILNGGFDASYYSDVKKKKKVFGITTSTKYSTQYTGADPLLENQFTLILQSFNDAILAAAGPLDTATSEIQRRLNSFVVNIGKIDLQGLTGAQIEEKLTAVFGAAADNMARAAFPFIDTFQKVGEGAFETLVRVSSTLEAVGSTLDLLGQSAQGMGIAAKLGLADQFESVSALTSAVDDYFQRYYTAAEQAAARTTQMATVFDSLGLAMPSTLAGFRELVEAQNLNSEAGRETYAILLQLAPAFADLQAAMAGAKSAADIASERADLERQLLELLGDTAALRALQLARLDISNRALQIEIWSIQDAQAAAKAADELRKAWQSVGDTIMDEVRRIRGLTDITTGNSFASLMGQFNAATTAARAGDMDAAKTLPQLSQALLAAAADAATSRQELDRIQAQAASSLEATYDIIATFAKAAPSSPQSPLDGYIPGQSGSDASNDNAAAESVDDLRAEMEQMRADLTTALAIIAANTGSMKKTLDNATGETGGNALLVQIDTAA